MPIKSSLAQNNNLNFDNLRSRFSSFFAKQLEPSTVVNCSMKDKSKQEEKVNSATSFVKLFFTVNTQKVIDCKCQNKVLNHYDHFPLWIHVLRPSRSPEPVHRIRLQSDCTFWDLSVRSCEMPALLNCKNV